jgi:hypothetical protein
MTMYAIDEWILVHVRDRLRLKVPEFTSTTCFICDIPVPDVLPSISPICTVCLGDSQYDEGTFMGSGPTNLCTHGSLIVTVLNQTLLDSVPKTEEAMIHHTRGLLRLKKPVLSALLVTDDDGWNCEASKDQWVPTIEGEHYLVERGFIPRGWSQPRFADRGGKIYLGTSLTLSFSYDQEL